MKDSRGGLHDRDHGRRSPWRLHGLHLADKGLPDIPDLAREFMVRKAAESLFPGNDGVWSLGVDEAVALALSRSFAVFAAFEAENEARWVALSSWSSVLPRASGSLSFELETGAPVLTE